MFAFRSPQALLEPHLELLIFPSTSVRELYTNPDPFQYSNDGLHQTLELLPALETLAFSKTRFPFGLLPALTEEPVLCPTLKTIAFLDCGVDSGIAEMLGEAIAKRRDSTAARLYRVVIVNSAGKLPDLKSIQQIRRSVPRVEAIVDEELPDLS